MTNRETVMRFFELMRTEGPTRAVKALATEDFVWWSPGAGEIQDQIDGLGAIIQKVFDDKGITMTIDGVTAEGDRVAVEARSAGNLRDGSHYRNTYHWLFLLRDGKIAVIKEYNDTAHLRDVLGPVFAS